MLLGYFIAGGVTKFKALSRTVEVKGLSEREVPANIAIWPIKFREGDNDLIQRELPACKGGDESRFQWIPSVDIIGACSSENQRIQYIRRNIT
jgi:hypothetical protein